MKKIKSLLSLFKLLFRKRRPVERLKLTDLSNAEFLQYSQSVIHSLTAHAANFPTPPPLLEAVHEMEEAMTARESDGAAPASLHVLSAARKKLRKQLQATVTYYRNAVSNSSGLIMAGFRRRKKRTING